MVPPSQRGGTLRPDLSIAHMPALSRKIDVSFHISVVRDSNVRTARAFRGLQLTSLLDQGSDRLRSGRKMGSRVTRTREPCLGEGGVSSCSPWSSGLPSACRRIRYGSPIPDLLACLLQAHPKIVHKLDAALHASAPTSSAFRDAPAYPEIAFWVAATGPPSAAR